MRKQIAVTAMLAGMICAPIIAEEITEETEGMDPADLTKVYREFTPTISSNLDIRLYTKLTGAWNKDIVFAAAVEGVFGTGTDEKKFGSSFLNGRVQYFQGHNTNISAIPRVGFSLDYINSRQESLPNDQLFALGGLFKLNHEYTGSFRLFPNVGYATGRMLNRDVDGVMANLFFTRYLGDTGGYIQFWPEFINVTGDDIRVQSKNLHVITTVPLQESKRFWFYTKALYESSNIKLNGAKLPTPASTSFNIGVRMYF